jgi:hypothetical protein
MAYQSTKKEYPKIPSLQHSVLVRNGPQLAIVKKVNWVSNNSKCIISLMFNGTPHNYWTTNKDIVGEFQKHVGHEVVMHATGDDRMNTDNMKIERSGVPTNVAIERPVTVAEKPQSAPQSPQKPVETVITAPVHRDKEAKQFLCQAANLMRLCVKKANDISVELGLPDQHRQGIATTLFINGDKQGYIASMPITAYTPEQLGFGASKAESLKKPQPND